MTEADADRAILDAKEDCWAFGKTSLEDMIDVTRFAASYFEGEQRARLIAGSIDTPSLLYMQYVVRMDDLGRLLEAMRDRPAEVARRLTRSRSS